ncbi:MAG: TniQ family protein, partial [Acidimicrobiales bacterium]
MRRIPIRLPLIEGESLDSWIAAYANRLQTPIRDLAPAIGLDQQFIAQPARRVAAGNGLHDLGRAADGCGLSPSEFEALWSPLSRYGAVAKGRFAKTALARLVRPMNSSRFCPRCLAENGGRWAALWRMPWWVGCPTHRCVLVSTCHACGGHQRERPPLWETDRPLLAACSAPIDGKAGRRARRCGADLTIVPAAAASDGMLAAQRPVAHLLDAGITDDHLMHGVEQLADLLTVAANSGLTSIDSDNSGLVDVSSMALALSRAHQALADPDGEILAELAMADVCARPHPLPRPWRTAGPALQSRVLDVRDPHLRPTDRLRWRTTTSGCQPRSQGAREALTQAMPHGLWVDWAIRLRPTQGIDASSFRLVAAAALLLPGAVDPIEALVAEWTPNPSPFAHKVSHVLFRLTRDDHGRAVLRAITQLSDALSRHGSPIDYQRRRRVAAEAELLDRLSWDRICASAGTPTGADRRLRNARLWLWETITGGLVQRAPEPLAPIEPSGLMAYYDFALHLLPVEVELLDERARRFLNDHGCIREPVTWSPPVEWVDLDGLPGPDPASIDVDRVSRLLRHRLSSSDVAEQLGVSIDHVRLVMRLHPQDLRPPRRRPKRNPVPTFLNPDRLRALILDDNQTIRSISRDFDVSRKTVAGAVRREGLPIPPAHAPPRHAVDPAWLRTEYVDRRRTLPDLAAEVGMTPTNLARIARRHGIPLRKRGGA